MDYTKVLGFEDLSEESWDDLRYEILFINFMITRIQNWDIQKEHQY